MPFKEVSAQVIWGTPNWNPVKCKFTFFYRFENDFIEGHFPFIMPLYFLQNSHCGGKLVLIPEVDRPVQTNLILDLTEDSILDRGKLNNKVERAPLKERRCYFSPYMK